MISSAVPLHIIKIYWYFVDYKVYGPLLKTFYTFMIYFIKRID